MQKFLAPILYTSWCAVLLWVLIIADTRTVYGCQLETVKEHAYKACDYIGDQLYDEHHRGLSRRSRRHVSESVAAANDFIETTRVHHNFTSRYHRPTHLSIRDLADGYLVTDFAYARILRKHPSRRFRIMHPHTHYRNSGGVLERVVVQTTDDDEEAEANNDDGTNPNAEHSAAHRRPYRRNHRHHPKSIESTDSTTTTTNDDNEMSNDVATEQQQQHRHRHSQHHRRRRRNANVAVSSCCRDIEQCMHLMCPL